MNIQTLNWICSESDLDLTDFSRTIFTCFLLVHLTHAIEQKLNNHTRTPKKMPHSFETSKMQQTPSNRCIIVTTSDITSMSTFVQYTNFQQIKCLDNYAAILSDLPHLGLSKSKNFCREQINAAFFFIAHLCVLWEMKKKLNEICCLVFCILTLTNENTLWIC